jgi:Zn-dependent protease
MGAMRGLGFTLGGIPVRVDPTFWIIMGLFGLDRAARRGGVDWFLVVEWVVLVFVGILVHEMGHAIAFRSFGRTPSVVLYGMGGLTSAAGALKPGQRLVTTLAGPLTGFALGGVVLLLAATGVWELPNLAGRDLLDWRLWLAASSPGLTAAETVFLDLLFINVGWGLLNLIPLHPLDGGQSLEALLSLLRVPQAERITSGIGVAVAVVAGLAAARIGSIFLVLIMAFLAFANVRRLQALGRPRAGAAEGSAAEVAALAPELQRSVALAEQALAQGRDDDAVEVLRQEHAYRPSPQAARAHLAVLVRARRLDDVERLLADAGEQIDPATATGAAAALVAGGRFESGLRTAEAAWTADRSGSWQPAVVAAAARAGLRDVDGAFRWLYTAADRGWDDRRRLDYDPVFAEVRADPRLPEVLARMGAGR